MSMTVRLVGFDRLASRELDAWHQIRDANPDLDSPCFHPGFAEAVHLSGRPVHVAVATDQTGEIRALLPCHRDGAILKPVGWPGADFQGPILARGKDFPATALLTGGVRGYEFDHLAQGYAAFEPWLESSHASPFLDTTGGFTAYSGRLSKGGKDTLVEIRRRVRKAERELGPLRFEADTVEPELLDRLIELKRSQYAATGARDYFAKAERRAMLHRLLHTRGTSFGGILSTLHAGPHLLAAHFGMRSGNVLHWWFPVYDPRWANLGGGWILLREMVSVSPELGFRRIDLGRGEEDYKLRAKTGHSMVSQGIVTTSGGLRMVRRVKENVIEAAKNSPLGPGLRRVVRGARHLKK
jgi:CelD/BcsL family acetyltransferase involved in cellulose biosynthesis